MTTPLTRENHAQATNTLPDRPWHLLLLSARTHAALDTATRNLALHLRQNADTDIAHVAFTLQVGRRVFEHRRSVVCRSLSDAIEALDDDDHSSLYSTRAAKDAQVAFVFSGKNAPCAATRELYESEPVFRQEIDRMAQALRRLLHVELLHLLYPGEQRADLAQPLSSQPTGHEAATFALEYALAKLWRSWGVLPSAVMGYGVGEYASACLAGVIEVEDAMALAVTRGRVMRGELEAGALGKLTQGLCLSPPTLPCMSSVTGAWLPDAEATDPSYWVRQLQWTSDLGAGVRTLCEGGCDVLLEVGPGHCLTSEQVGAEEKTPICLRSLPDSQSPQSGMRGMLEALGRLYGCGVPIDWAAFHEGREPHRTPLPGYPFERHPVWYAAHDEPKGAGGRRSTGGEDDPQGEPPAAARHARPEFGTAFVAACSETQATVVAICEALLGIDGIGVYDNIVELGADSLFTLQLSERIAEDFGVRISPHHLFVEPHVASLASQLERAACAKTAMRERPATVERDADPLGGISVAEYDEILALIEGLSNEEIEQLLASVDG